MFAACALFACSVSRAQPNLVLLLSPPGDYIGLGLTYYTSDQAEIGISGSRSTVQVTAFGYYIMFDAPGGSDLMVGRFTNAVSFPGNADVPGLSVLGNGRSCLSTACGAFDIREIRTDGSGQVVGFWATFSQS
ncbi:MAG: hypothetical protein DME25_11660, partial [Verrucomicrobia bacterium]